MCACVTDWQLNWLANVYEHALPNDTTIMVCNVFEIIERMKGVIAA